MSPLVSAHGLSKEFTKPGFFGWRGKGLHAVSGVDIDIDPGEVVGLVGESGSGKSTIGRLLLRLVEPTAGTIEYDGRDLLKLSPSEMRAMRRQMQIVFQDPFSCLDPRRRAGEIVGEALDIHRMATGRARHDRVAELFEAVGLPIDYIGRYPHQFSGGQRQRLGIARALAVEPRFIVADEPVSALDVSIQAQIVNLMADLQRRLGLAMLFISHDLGVVEHLSDRIVVLYLGRVMETAPAGDLYRAPRHPYTMALLSSAPTIDPDKRPERIKLGGDPPSPSAPPSGCVFRTRCPFALPDCAVAVPELAAVGARHLKACIRDDIPPYNR